jgi:hypothetical protein
MTGLNVDRDNDQSAIIQQTSLVLAVLVVMLSNEGFVLREKQESKIFRL